MNFIKTVLILAKFHDTMSTKFTRNSKTSKRRKFIIIFPYEKDSSDDMEQDVPE